MKIIHLTFSPYNDNWSYQDNLLPKYQKKLGHEVIVVTTNTQHGKNGIEVIDESTYFLEDGTKIIRMRSPYASNQLLKRLNYYPIYELLVAENPDIVMCHGLVSITVSQVIKYKKKHNRNCKIILDNHQDDTISRINKSLLGNTVGLFYNFYHKLHQKYYHKVYGVTPWRVDFARDVFGIRENKLDLLLMGADDAEIQFEQSIEIRERIRNKNNIDESDFVFVTGGKLDSDKKTIETIKAFKHLSQKNIKLLIFGSVHQDIKHEFDKLVQTDNRIIYVGFIKSTEMYDYFFASDCAVFAGQHSVIWEQAVAAGIPAIFRKYVDGYVDIGGNCILLDSITEKTIQKAMEKVVGDQQLYQTMKNIAQSDAKKQFFYSEIAKKSLE